MMLIDELLRKNGLSRRRFLRALGLMAGATVLGSGLVLRGQDVIKIGVLGPIKLFSFGQDMPRAVEFAIEDIKELLGKKLQMVMADTSGERDEDPRLAVQAAENLVNREGVKLLIGNFRSEAAVAVADLMPRLRVPYIITGATDPGVTGKVAADYANFKYIFRVLLNGSFLAFDIVNLAARFIRTELVEKGIITTNKVAVVAEDLLFTRPFSALLGSRLPQLGFNLVANERVAIGADFDPTFAKLAAQLKAGESMTILTVFSVPQSALPFHNTWATLRFPAAVFGLNAAALDPAFSAALLRANPTAVGYTFQDIAEEVEITPLTKAYFKRFTDKHGRRPVYTGVLTYDGTRIWAEAVNRAKTTDSDAVVAELEKTKHTGVGGRYEFFSLTDAANDPQNLAKPHDPKYSAEFVYPVHVQIQQGGKRAPVFGLGLDPKLASPYVKPPWLP